MFKIDPYFPIPASISPLDFSAVGNGIADDTAAVIAAVNYAAANSYQLRGANATYAVSGDVVFDTISNINIDGLKLKQLTPNDVNRKTLYFTNCPAMRLRNITVDRNGLGTQGGLNSAAGIWIRGGSGHRCYNLEGFGSGKGNGVVIQLTSDSVYDCLYGRDIAYDEPGATDDRVQGVWLYLNTNCIFNSPMAKNLSGNPTGQTPLRFTRGIAMGGNVKCTLVAPHIDGADQGIDISGSDGNIDCQILGGTAKNVSYWGVKLANTQVRCKVIGFTTENPGICGVVVAGPDNAYTYQTMDCLISGCTTINAGTPYAGVSGTTAGFRIMNNSHNIDFPKGIRFVDCDAISTDGNMQFGFHSEIDYAANDGTSKKLNELINGRSIGHTVAMSSGFASWNCSLYGSTSQTLTTGTLTSIDWDSEEYDTAVMHSASVNINQINIKVDGLYRIDASINFNANATGEREIRLRRNGSDIRGARTSANAVTGGDDTVLNVSTVMHLSAGDNVTVMALQKSGGNVDVQRAQSFFKVTLLQQF